MKIKNIVIIVLSVVIGLLVGFIIYDKVINTDNNKAIEEKMEKTEENVEIDNEIKEEITKEENNSTIAGEVSFYASEDDKHVLILTTYKNRNYLNQKAGVKDDAEFILTIDSMQFMNTVVGTYTISDNMISLNFAAGDGGSDFSSYLPAEINVKDNSIELNYTNDSISLGNVTLYKK